MRGTASQNSLREIRCPGLLWLSGATPYAVQSIGTSNVFTGIGAANSQHEDKKRKRVCCRFSPTFFSCDARGRDKFRLRESVLEHSIDVPGHFRAGRPIGIGVATWPRFGDALLRFPWRRSAPGFCGVLAE
ncbi:UNVERIFIED_CONTAM: hypothetical protein Sangu_3199100 [Sesamum angustifolium]|uniref:Uncharacterized protein n=1 Tax=Sesamum angustifolium TaxID=2727405 RepID=A0AAW2JP61_9LAMI